MPANMPQRHDAPRGAAETATAIPRAERHRPKYGSSHQRNRRGRLWLLLLFFCLRASDALLYLGVPATDKSRLFAAICVGAIWTTAALCGIWARQDWCRGGASFLILASTLCSTPFVPGLYQLPANERVLIVFFAAMTINGLVVWAVACLPDIRRLTSRAYQ